MRTGGWIWRRKKLRQASELWKAEEGEKWERTGAWRKRDDR